MKLFQKKQLQQVSVFDGELELVITDDEVCISGTSEGFRRICGLINDLEQKSEGDHIHLEDYELLTTRSMKAVLIKKIRDVSQLKD